MNTATKISKHRLSGGFDPKSYTFVECFDHRTMNEAYDHIDGTYAGEVHDPLDSSYIEELESNGYNCDQCTHCGTHLKHGSVYRHTSGELVVIGPTCVNRLQFESASEIQAEHIFNRLRLARLRSLMKRNWRWKIVGEFLIENEQKNHIIGDMLNKLNKYFSLSRRQIAFARKLVRQADEREAREAEREAKLANTPDWQDGREEIEGKVLSCKFKDSDFGGSYKLLIELEDGRRCWGSAPQKYLDAVDENQLSSPIIRIKATFSASNDDKKFAFYKRPTFVSVTSN